MGSAAIHTLILVVTTVFCKLLGYARELVLAYRFGASAISDAYIVAFSIPYIVFSGIGTAILTSYIPIATRLERSDPKEQKRFLNNVITIVLLLTLAFIGVFLPLRSYIVRIFAVGFADDTFALTVRLSTIMLFSIIFIGVYFIIEGFLEMRGRFFAVGLVSVPLNILVVATILLCPDGSYDWLGWGVVLGYFASFLMLYIAAKPAGFSYRPSFDFKNSSIRRLAMMVLPIFVSKTIHQLNVLLDRTLASTLAVGSVSSISYGNRITGFVTSVFVVSLTTAIFPQLSRLSVANNVKKMKSMLSTSIGIMSFLVLPISAGVMIFSGEIVQILFQRGAFDAQATVRTAQVLTYYAAGLVFFSIKDVLLNAFYAIEDTRTPTINSAIALVINFALNVVLMRLCGIAGLAMATSISGAITMVLMFYSLRKRIGLLGMRPLLLRMVRMVIATLVMVIAVVAVYDLLLKVTTMLPAMALSVLTGVLVYGAAAILLRIREMGLIVVAVAERLGGRKKEV